MIISWCKIWFTAKWINEIWGKFWFGGGFLDGFLFIFDDDGVVIDFDDFTAVDDKFGVKERFEDRVLNDELLNGESVGIDGKTGNFAKFGAFFGFNW